LKVLNFEISKSRSALEAESLSYSDDDGVVFDGKINAGSCSFGDRLFTEILDSELSEMVLEQVGRREGGGADEVVFCNLPFVMDRVTTGILV
jgi:hypothetical protein